MTHMHRSMPQHPRGEAKAYRIWLVYDDFIDVSEAQARRITENCAHLIAEIEPLPAPRER